MPQGADTVSNGEDPLYRADPASLGRLETGRAVIGQVQLLPDYTPLLRRENAERLTDLPEPRPGLRSLPGGGSPARPSKSFAAATIRP
jgi:hypothetical protein